MLRRSAVRLGIAVLAAGAALGGVYFGTPLLENRLAVRKVLAELEVGESSSVRPYLPEAPGALDRDAHALLQTLQSPHGPQRSRPYPVAAGVTTVDGREVLVLLQFPSFFFYTAAFIELRPPPMPHRLSNVDLFPTTWAGYRSLSSNDTAAGDADGEAGFDPRMSIADDGTLLLTYRWNGGIGTAKGTLRKQGDDYAFHLQVVSGPLLDTPAAQPLRLFDPRTMVPDVAVRE